MGVYKLTKNRGLYVLWFLAALSFKSTKYHIQDLMLYLTNKDGTANIKIYADNICRWSAPYRFWHYQPNHIIPPKPEISGFENIQMTDVPTVYKLQGEE